MNLRKGFAKGEGYDTLRNINVVRGSAFNDVIVGTDNTQKMDHAAYADFSEVLEGRKGADKIVGLGGPDLLAGDSGNDRLMGVDGEVGNDSLDGGIGTDTCLGDSTTEASDPQGRCEN